MNSTYKFLQNAEIKMVKEMQDILVKGGGDGRNRNATHKLSNSFQMELKRSTTGFIIKIMYAAHGKYVLDSRRRVTKAKPSKLAIDKIKAWITAKGIPVSGGRLRTPLASKSGGKAARVESKSKAMDKELTSFAFAIWFKMKRDGKISTLPTDFLKPYHNLVKNNIFKYNLKRALKKDAIIAINIKDMNNKSIKITT